MNQTDLDLPGDLDPEHAIASAEAAGDALALDKWPRRLLDLIDVTEATLARAGLPDARARAEEVVIEIARYNGGKQFYLPFGSALNSLLRARRVWRDAGHLSADELASREGVSGTQIYRDIGTMRALERHRRQGNLFGGGALPTLGGRVKPVS